MTEDVTSATACGGGDRSDSETRLVLVRECHENLTAFRQRGFRDKLESVVCRLIPVRNRVVNWRCSLLYRTCSWRQRWRERYVSREEGGGDIAHQQKRSHLCFGEDARGWR